MTVGSGLHTFDKALAKANVWLEALMVALRC